MLGRIAEAAGTVVEIPLSTLGVRVGTEEPKHTTQPLGSGVELRRYGPRIAAETTVSDDEERARNAGFRRLAGYIFGGNDGGARIAMTAPVAQQSGTRIAMTAPVAQSASADGEWVIRFFMPSKWTLEGLPTPDDDRVRLVTVPEEVFAVLRFSGDRGPRAVARQTERLRHSLQAFGFDRTGEPVAWFYDPPWTLPFRRRNEIAIPVDA